VLFQNNLIKTIIWYFNKLYYKYLIRNHTYQYPRKINDIVKNLDNLPPISRLNDTNKFISKINNINLASKKIEISLNTIGWLADFKDPEDTESIHRWNWMIYEISKKNNQISLDELLFYQRDWYKKFLNEIDNDDNKKYLRWSSYSVAERISNSIIIFNYFDTKIPTDIIDCLAQQAHHLSKNLEYFEKNTGNHIINNARALYLYSVFTGDNRVQKLAKEIFYDQLHRIISRDGFLREGSSHYHFLILRWLLEIYYFSLKFKDVSFSEYLTKYIFDMTEKSLHFLYKNKHEVFSISLFGDISPDFDPEWLASLISSNVMPLNIESLPESKLPLYSWNNLWCKIEKISNEKSQTINFEINNINHFYLESGWFFLNNNKTRLLIRADKQSIQNNVGHYNQDLFHINILLNNAPFLISLGRLNYNLRDSLGKKGILSQAHNSIFINDLPYMPSMVNYFPVEYCQSENIIKFNKEINELTIHSNCFKRISNSITVNRKITLNDEYINIQDTIDGNSVHSVSRFFYFHNNVILNSNKLLNKNKRLLEFICNDRIVIFEIYGDNINDIELSILNEYKEIHSYGKYNYCTGIKLKNKKNIINCYNIKIR